MVSEDESWVGDEWAVWTIYQVGLIIKLLEIQVAVPGESKQPQEQRFTVPSYTKLGLG